ncbi:type I restriction enzyme S subunit [Arthrobacter sp. UYCu512]|uniref:restriction endonuclease subunit S n=1 Tax=Arthrobacter sp. UYCu512 TaxID=3156338 RepID=UPI0033927AE6
MSEWREVTLSQLGEVNRGRSRHRPRYAEHLYGGTYPFIQTGDVKASGGRISQHSQTYSESGLAQSRLWPAGTMCITIAANIAETGVLDFPACFPDSIVGFIADSKVVDVRFIEYAFRTLKAGLQHQAAGSGSVQDNINLATLARLKFLIPELSEQRAIADVLGALDDKIASNTRLISKTGEVLETSFALLCGLPQETIPFSEMASITKGVSYRSADLLESSNALVTLKSFDRNGGYSLRGLKEYAGPFKPAQEVAPGELVVAQTDLTQEAEVIGRAVRVPRAPGYEKLVASLDLAIVRPRQDSPVEFLLGVMLQGRFRAHCRSRTSGTTVLHLASDAISTFQAPLVSQDIQENYASVARPILQLRDSLEYEMDSLASTRDALLPQLVSGKLRVRDAEKVLENAGV